MARNEDPWTAEKRRQAYVAVQVASVRQVAGTNTLAYFIRLAMGHGLTLEDICQAANLSPATVLRLSDPSTVAA